MERMLLRVAEVAEALGIGRSKAYELVADGTIPSVRLGGCVRVPVDSLRAWVSAQSDEGPRSDAPRSAIQPGDRQR